MKQSVTNETPSILQSTQPILYETGCEEWPYAFAGSCFPVRWKHKLYVVSAFHCYANHGVTPEQTLYPIPGKASRFFGFRHVLRAKIAASNDQKHFDHVAIEVADGVSETSGVEALDLSDESALMPLADMPLRDVWLRGYLTENAGHEIDYETRKIRQQAYVTNGIVSCRKSTSDHCFLLKVKTPIPAGLSADGMSGSAVYAQDRNGRIGLAGVVIEFNDLTDEYLVIDSAILRELFSGDNSQAGQ